MDVLNSASLRVVEQSARRRVEATRPGEKDARAQFEATLIQARDIATVGPMASSPVNRAISDIVSNSQSYAAALVAIPGVIPNAMLQTVADVAILARLGQKAQPTTEEVRDAASTMLSEARARAKDLPGPNHRIALLFQAIGDAGRTARLDGSDGACRAVGDLLPRLVSLSASQSVPENRARVLAQGVKVLSGLLASRPQSVEHRTSQTQLPGAVMGLTPRRREQFVELWDRFQDASVRIPRRQESELFSVQDALGRLARTGALDQRDSHGNDLLTNLAEFGRSPATPGIDRDLLVAQSIVHASFPGRSMSQGTHRTCAAAVVSYQLAHNRPSEYVRLVRGLASEAGEVTLASGDVAHRHDEALADDGSGRSTVERVVQSALMDAGGSKFAGSRYHNLVDGFLSGTEQMVQTGVYPREMVRLEEAVGEGPFQVVERPTRERLLETLRHGGGVPVTLKWDNDEDHWVLARGVDNDRVFFRNPHGHRRTDRVTLIGADHQLHEEGIESLPVDEFVARARALLEKTG